MNTSKGGARAIVVVAVVVAVMIGGVVFGLLSWAQSSGAELQQTFFNAVLSGDANLVTARFHPDLRELVDEPVLAQWMAAVKDKFGGLKGLSKLDFATSTEVKNGVTTTKSSGTVNFEKGSAHSELTYVNGKIVGFHVNADGLSSFGDWFHDVAPDQSQFYRDRGQRFLTLFLTDKPDGAFGMMHESLQKAAPMDKLKSMMAAISSELGAMKNVEFQSAQAEGAGKLKILYQVRGEKASTLASVKFQHEPDGWKYHLIAFKLNEDAEPAERP